MKKLEEMVIQQKVKLEELNGMIRFWYILKVELMRFADGLVMGCESHGPIPMSWEVSDVIGSSVCQLYQAMVPSCLANTTGGVAMKIFLDAINIYNQLTLSKTDYPL